MHHFKDPSGKPHALESLAYAHLLPVGSIQISPAEAAALVPQTQPTYAELRRAEYPPLIDLIDGMVKDDAAQVQAYKDACLAVKAKYPKP